MTNSDLVLGIKVDVDTLVGYRRGVRELLHQLDAAGVRAGFFFSVGPDRSGAAIRRVFTRRGFLGKMLRNRAPATYGLRTMLYGTLLPAPPIVASEPAVVRDVYGAGHETCVHGWDHVGWHDGLERMPAEQIRRDLDRCFAELAEITGHTPRSFAAPGWQSSPHSLAEHDRRELAYASDTRLVDGPATPFLPRMNGTVYTTPQLPTNLPTLDEMWGITAKSAREAVTSWLKRLAPGLNVVTVHAEIEGMALPEALPGLLDAVKSMGGRICAPEEMISLYPRGHLPVRDVLPIFLPGRAGRVCAAE